MLHRKNTFLTSKNNALTRRYALSLSSTPMHTYAHLRKFTLHLRCKNA